MLAHVFQVSLLIHEDSTIPFFILKRNKGMKTSLTGTTVA